MTIEVIDLLFQGRPGCVAAFLVNAPEGPFLIECGPATSRSALLAALEQRGLGPSQLRGLLVTHIHLDHSGDAGWWAQQGVPVWVHPLGAPHLLDPSKLLQSAGRIYGDQMEALWGHIVPCPQGTVQPLEPDQPFQIGGLTVTPWDSPGHARHHLAYQVGAALFCGDVAGVRLPLESPPERGALSVPAPPPEFDREAWLSTIERLRTLEVDTLYLTHFGAVTEPAQHWAQLAERVEAVAEFVGQRQQLDRDRLVEEYYAWQRPLFPDEATMDRYEKANPLFMSVDGLLRYWKKRS